MRISAVEMDFLNGVLAMVPIWLLWPVLVGIAVYWYLTKDKNLWASLGIPHVKGIPIFGSVLELFTNNLHDVERNRYVKHGRIFGTYEGSRPVLIVGEPDILRNILVKDFPVFTGRRRFDLGLPLTDNMVSNMQGEDWKRVRTVITPAFSTGKIKKMISIFRESAKTVVSNFKSASKEAKPIDAKRLFGAFTMDVIASSAFATKIDSHNDPENRFVTAARGAFTNPIPWRFALFFTFPGIMRLFRINLFSPTAMEFFQKVTLQLVEERKRTKQRRNDFLQLLLDAVERDEKDTKDTEEIKESEETKEMGHEEANEQVFSSYHSSKKMSNIELVANSVIFFLAGYDTTASTLTFTAFELATNPQIQEKAIKEIDEAVREKGGLNYEALCEMKYLDNIISETLRKYPPAVRTDRVAEEDYEIKDPHSNINITVPKGMIVAVPVYAIHHDPEHYPNPQKYDPDRFSQEQKSSRHPYAYLPFGAGPRNCVGMRFALMEIKLCLAAVLSEFRFKTCPQTQIPLEFLKGQGLMQPKQILLKVEIRSDAIKL